MEDKLAALPFMLLAVSNFILFFALSFRIDRIERKIIGEGKQPEIIRCKDCKWFNDAGCAVEIVDESDRPEENDFCSWAERRQDE